MTKFNIFFNGKNYSIEASDVASALAELRTHLQNSMSGSGAVIKLGGNTYNVDSTKLTNERNTFISHLGTIAGTGSKVTVNEIEYGVDSSKMSIAMAELTTTFNTLSGGSEPIDPPVVVRAAGLYETGTDTMTASWDELLAEGALVVNNGTITVGATSNGALPDMNEYGFYYGAMYSMSMDDGMTASMLFNNDGSFQVYTDGVLGNTFPANSAIYSNHAIDLSIMGFGICSISNDGTSIMVNGMGQFNLSNNQESAYIIVGDLVLPNDNSITVIPESAFGGQSSLTSITIPDSVTSIADYALSYCSGLTSVVIPNSVTTIGDSAFYECSSLTSITIPNSATSIGYEAFYGCSSLTSITIPDSVTSIGYRAFRGCSGLTSITIPDGVTYIDEDAFYGCSSLTSITIPVGVTSIRSNMFYECHSLTSITIPDSVTYIHDSAFYGCSSLANVYYTGTEAQWQEISVENVFSANSLFTNATITYNYVA